MWKTNHLNSPLTSVVAKLVPCWSRVKLKGAGACISSCPSQTPRWPSPASRLVLLRTAGWSSPDMSSWACAFSCSSFSTRCSSARICSFWMICSSLLLPSVLLLTRMLC